jgi:uncharacterized protein YndB with AHSA1/START domain
MTNNKNNYLIKKSIIVKAVPSQIWKAMTNGEWTKKYMYGYEVKSDWKVGSSILWILKKNGKDYSRVGKVLEVVPNKFLKISDFNPNNGEEDIESNYAVITYELLALTNGETELCVTDDYANNEKKYKESEQFWNNVLPKLKELLEVRKTLKDI